MNTYIVSRAKRELQDEYLCLMEAKNEIDQNNSVSYDLCEFYDLLSDRIKEVREKMIFLEGISIGLNDKRDKLPKISS